MQEDPAHQGRIGPHHGQSLTTPVDDLIADLGLQLLDDAVEQYSQIDFFHTQRHVSGA